MAVIFPRWTNRIPLILGAAAPVGLTVVVAAFWYWGSPLYTDVGYQHVQPVPFSHRVHAGELGMDCRYCHNTVERGARAAVPPTATCMNCHTAIHKASPKLAPIRESAASGNPVEWVRVHMMPDYAFFDHSVHLAAGVGCVSCHGRVDKMETVRQAHSLSMSWCLDCHRNPYPNLRPRSEITNMNWDAKRVAYDPYRDPARTRRLDPPLHCSGCHR